MLYGTNSIPGSGQEHRIHELASLFNYSPHGIGVATGEMCMNRVMFKQLLQANAIEFCQIDSARMGGVNEILAVYFMAKKCNGSILYVKMQLRHIVTFYFCSVFVNAVKVCPHAGGVGLCEMVQHLQMWDYASVSCTKNDRYVEYVDQQHEQFVHPTVVKNAHYTAPLVSRTKTS